MAATVTAGLALSVPPAHATSLTFPPGVYILACEAGTNLLTINGSVYTKDGVPYSCGRMETLYLHIGEPGETRPSTVDLRGIVGLRPDRFRGTSIEVFGPVTFYGSPYPDAVEGVGTMYGNGGADALRVLARNGPAEVISRAFGGPGGDALSCDAARYCELDGGEANDSVIHAGVGRAAGGGGNDNLLSWSATVDGGSGTDTVIANHWERITGTPVAGIVGACRLRGETAGQPMVEWVANRVESLVVRAESAKVTMSPSLPIEVQARPDLTVRVLVPSATWSVTGNVVTAPGLRPVTVTAGLIKVVPVA